ncbi:carbohydrate ABC transporter substrate-binding protein [Martelella alba]|uniref:Carbohydrate ABC transporter substrate-binding protein n=1 Tax=Martelella alba TaxID=2590451 RepID=A0A506UEE0_9HYPH|nr:ABC transporter substrate-binding protein [Martelella alba]TPW31796.1 carbohydrate ABC transporter substrate-binding protein [Martelella alba]
MSNLVMNRRRFLGASAGLASMPLWAPGLGLAADAANIRMVWWGSEERARRTTDAVKAFEAANAGISVETESMGWDDYWTRLATQVAGGNAPDFMQMDYRYVSEYARRGAILPLDDYLGSVLKIEDFGKVNLDSCSVDGKLYGGNVGVNSFGTILDPQLWQDAGVEPPTYGTSWDEFTEKCKAYSAATKAKAKYATADASGSENLFEGWLRENGKALYTGDGEIGYDADDAAKWFTYWADMRKAKACVPADIQGLYKNSIETSPLTLGYSASDFAFSNQFVGFQKLNQPTLEITAQPVTPDGKPAHYLKPSQMFSIYTKSKVPEQTAMLINFLIADPAGALILGVERGVPASPAIREALMPTLDAPSAKAVQFISDLSPYVGDLPPAPPQGAGEMNAVLIRISQEVAFEASSPEDAGKALVAEAQSVLKRG